MRTFSWIPFSFVPVVVVLSTTPTFASNGYCVAAEYVRAREQNQNVDELANNLLNTALAQI